LWWRDLRKVWYLEGWGNDFEDRGRWEVGDGKEIRLWEDKWLDNIPLAYKFPRLYLISLDTGCTLSQVGAWNNNFWSWKLRWRRNLFVWESSLAEFLMQSLKNKRLTREGGVKPDKWIWRDVDSTDFSVKATYQVLLGEENVEGEDVFASFWNLKTLPSAQFTAWRVLCNVIPTKDNLSRRGLLLISDRCPLCSVEEESVRHLFFECRISWRIWGMCVEWLGLSSALHRDAQIHFRMFNPIGLNHTFIRCWGGIWVGTVSEIWNHRKKVVFENGRVDLVEVFTVVQRKTWSSVTVKEILAIFSYSDLCLEPHCCMRYLKE